jgi:LCP family protein required for cell wall assembly
MTARIGTHTVGQKVMLALNIVLVVACFSGAGVLLYLKSAKESFLAVPAVEVGGTAAPVATPAPAPGDGTTPPTSAGGPPETFPAADPQAQNFLVVGEPNNACVGPDSPWANAADGERGVAELSDTIMVIRVDPQTRQAAVLSFQRDLWVEIAGRGSKNRINSAYKKNDYSRLAETIFQNFGVKVDHYLQIDFCAFKSVVDELGGVAVPFDRPIRDPKVNLLIEVPGCHTFSGDEALAYVRSRSIEYQDENGEWRDDNGYDFGRVSRQQDFIRRMLQTALDKGLFNPSLARTVLEAMSKYVVTEEGFSIDEMLQFAGVLRDVDPTTLATYQVENRGTMIQGKSVLIPKLDTENMQAILAVFQGTAPLAGAPEQVFETTTTLPPATTEPGDTSEPAESIAPAGTEPAVETTVAPAAPGPVDQEIRGEVPDRNKTCS